MQYFFNKKELYFIIPSILILVIFFKFLKNQTNNIKIKTDVIISGVISQNPNKYKNLYKIKLNGINIELNSLQAKKIQQGSYVELVGKTDTRVIWGFYKQNWLIYPDLISIQEDLSLNKYNYVNYFNQRFYQTINKLNKHFIVNFRKLFPEHAAALISGMVLGTKDLFSSQSYAELKDSGLIHLAVASGTNVAFLLIFFLSFITWFPIKGWFKFILMELLLLTYAIIAGFDPPIIRATLMLSLIYLAKLKGRKVGSLWVLGNTILIMISLNIDLITSLSFYMSIIATYAVVYYADYIYFVLESIRRHIPLVKRMRKFSKKSEIYQILSVQLWLWPLILLIFGKINLLAFFSNLAVGFAVPIIMSVGILLLFISLFSLPIGQILAWFILPILTWINFVAKISSEHAIFINIRLSVVVVTIWWLILLSALTIRKYKYA